MAEGEWREQANGEAGGSVSWSGQADGGPGC